MKRKSGNQLNKSHLPSKQRSGKPRWLKHSFAIDKYAVESQKYWQNAIFNDEKEQLKNINKPLEQMVLATGSEVEVCLPILYLHFAGDVQIEYLTGFPGTNMPTMHIDELETEDHCIKEFCEDHGISFFEEDDEENDKTEAAGDLYNYAKYIHDIEIIKQLFILKKEFVARGFDAAPDFKAIIVRHDNKDINRENASLNIEYYNDNPRINKWVETEPLEVIEPPWNEHLHDVARLLYNKKENQEYFIECNSGG